MDNDRRKLTNNPTACLWAILLMALPFAGHLATAQEEAPLSRGAVILAERNGPVAFLNENNQSLGDAYTISGMLIPQSTSIRTGVGGSVILLLSNGSLVTIEENTIMKVASFVQEPFDDKGRSLKDLEEEPSSSSVLVDLEIGSLVVKTKKLNKQSNFEIASPVGTAGIRGTQFGMGFTPRRGMSLDVTESTVSFRPRGGGPAQMVPAGRGLSAPPRGRPVARPINPVARGKINASNNRATRSTSNYSLGYVTSSMKKETREKPPTKSEDRRRKENRQSPGETQPGTQEPGSGETEQPNEPGRPNREGGQPGETREPGGGRGEGPGAERPAPGREGGGPGRANAGSGQGRSPQGQPTPPAPPKPKLSMSDRQVATAQILENNPDVKQARKTGKVSKATKELAKLGLSDKQTNRFHSFPPQLQSLLLKEKKAVTKRLLGMDRFGPGQADAFFAYKPETRSKILGLPDEAALALLDQGLAEALIAATLTELNLKASDPSKVPSMDAVILPASSSLDHQAIALGEKLRISGNSHVMDELKSQSGGQMTTESLRVAEVADMLLTDYSLADASAAGPSALTGAEVLSNPFYREIASLYQELETEQLVAGESGFLSGRNMIVTANSQALAPYAANAVDRRTLVLSASESLSLQGDISWSDQPEHSARLVVMSAGDMNLAKGMTLSSATSDLVLSSTRNLALDGIGMEVSGEAVIRGMRDVSLIDVRIGADALATVRATRNLDVNGLTFSRSVSSILMEATTIRLSNVSFPGSSMVRLNSLKGPIDGKYPNFGTAIPAAQQVGRVNFIQNVSSGGNLLNTRQAFDQFGGNITIGKTGQP